MTVSSAPVEPVGAHRASVVTVWLAAVAAGVAVSILAPDEDLLAWFAFALLGCAFLAFGLQLAVRQKAGFVGRAGAAIAGAAGILGAASVLALLLGR